MADGTIPYPLINGFRYSWASLRFLILGAEEVGVKEIAYKATVTRGVVRGAGRRKLGRTKGNIDFDGSLTMLKEEYNNLIAKLGPGYMDVEFDIVVRYEEGDDIHEDKIVGCLLDEEDNSHANGTEGLEIKVKLNIMYYEHDGVPHIPRDISNGSAAQ